MNRPIDIKTLRNLSDQIPEKKNEVAEDTVWGMQHLEKLLNKEFSFRRRALTDKTKESFYLELGSLMAAGLDISTALQLIRDEQHQKTSKTILTLLVDKIINGSSLSAAMKEDKNFTSYEYFTIEIGEETGRLPAVMQQLAVYYKAKIKQRRQIISALSYPAIVMTVASCSVLFMMNFVVPMFADVFKRFGGELPFLTRHVLNISHFIQAVAGKLLLLLIAGAVTVFLNRDKPWYKKYQALLVQKIPLVKNIISRIYLTRFAGTLQLLLGAKVPLVQALGLCKQIVGFYPLEQAVGQMEQDILKGMTLHESMSVHSIFPSKMVALVKVGEEVNELELFFKTLSERYSEELDYQTSQLGKFIEPVIIVILGLVVGIVLIAMYLPMFNMGNTIQ